MRQKRKFSFELSLPDELRFRSDYGVKIKTCQSYTNPLFDPFGHDCPDGPHFKVKEESKKSLAGAFVSLMNTCYDAYACIPQVACRLR